MKAISCAFLAAALLCAAHVAFCQDANPPIYSEVIPTSSGLPYNPATDFRETFVAPNGKTVEVLVKGPQGSGTYSRAIHKGETPDVYFPAIIDEAIKAKAHHIVIPKGVYAFRGPQLCTDLTSSACNQPSSCNANQYYNCNPMWTIGQYPSGQVKEPDSVSDLDIDFSGSELDFNTPTIGIWILEAQRLRLRNFTVDWPDLPIASLGTVVRDPDNPGHNALVLDSKYPVKDKYQGGAVQIQAVDVWDENKSDAPGAFDALATNSYEEYFIFGNAPQPTYVGKTSAGAQTFSCKSCHFVNSNTDPACSFFSGCANFDIFSPGTRVIVRHYTYNGFAFLVNWSNDIDIENLKLRTGPGMGISVSNEGGYRGFRLANSEIKRGPGRLISTASDAMDVTIKADFIVENNDIGYQGDDSFNFYPTTVPLSGVHEAQVEVAPTCTPDPMDYPIAGDTLAFFDTNFVYKGTARVTAAQGTSCSTTLGLTLDHAIAGLNSTSSLLDLTQQGSARYVLRNNMMHECRCHGLFTNAPYGLVANNLMFDTSAGSIQLSGGSSEGPGSTNLSIIGNTMIDPGQGAQYNGALYGFGLDANGNVLSTPTFEKIDIENNTIVDSPGPGMIVASARYFTIAGNTIVDSNQNPGAPQDYGTLPTLDSLLIYKSSQGTMCGNYLQGANTGPVGIDPTAHSILLQPDCE